MNDTNKFWQHLPHPPTTVYVNTFLILKRKKKETVQRINLEREETNAAPSAGKKEVKEVKEGGGGGRRRQHTHSSTCPVDTLLSVPEGLPARARGFG